MSAPHANTKPAQRQASFAAASTSAPPAAMALSGSRSLLDDASPWRSSAARLARIYLLLYALGICCVLALVSVQANAYMARRVDRLIDIRLQALVRKPPSQWRQAIGEALANDPRHVNLYGWFDSRGRRLAGNVQPLPPALAADEQIHAFRYRRESADIDGQLNPSDPPLARGQAMHLGDGSVLVVGRDIGELAEVRSILLQGLLTGGGGVLLLGVLAGVWLTRRSRLRVASLHACTHEIMQGRLEQRLPLAGNHDDLDLLAAMVNTMLDEVERLLVEVKGMTDHVAHDLRTPLTRLRLTLVRGRQQQAEASPSGAVFEQALAEVDQLLGRFRALLRISEIENSLRKQGFGRVDLALTVAQIIELYEPLAEARDVALMADCVPGTSVYADGDLMLEVLGNLVDNALTHTPPGGQVVLSVSDDDTAVSLGVKDSGCGIPVELRERVFQRHWAQRPPPLAGLGGQAGSDRASGHGLGLSIVAAILRLHGFGVDVGDARPGTWIRIHCPKDPLPRQL